MDLAGERRLAVDRATAWQALNDPAVLKASIPGCEAIEKTSDNEYALTVAAVLGPVRTKFRGRLLVENVVVPERYTLRFEGEGGAAGFAKGSADVSLTPSDGATVLRYKVAAQVGGRIAQVGNRLIDSAALKLADEFFAAFEKMVSGTISSPPRAQANSEPGLSFTRGYTRLQVVLIALILVALVAAVAYTLR